MIDEDNMEMFCKAPCNHTAAKTQPALLTKHAERYMAALAGSRKQEAGSRKQEAGSRKQEAGSRK